MNSAKLYYDMPAFHIRLHQELLGETYPKLAGGDSTDHSGDYVLLDRLRADNRVVFVNMTADWCVTCKANEKAVLNTAAFRDLLAAHEAVGLLRRGVVAYTSV